MTPEIALILGTGLGDVVLDMEIEKEIPYSELHLPYIPHVEGHARKLLYGTLHGKKTVVFQGRFHLYEGYGPEIVTFPVKTAHEMGCKKLLIASACGGLNPQYQKGDLMVITDHINLMGTSPLVGYNDDRVGPRFPDMSDPYLVPECPGTHRGVYAGVLGPQLETKSEYRMLRMLGADAVGMSTVPEVIAAVHRGMKVFAVGVITDLCDPDNLQPAKIEDILEAAAVGGKKYRELLEKLEL